MRLLIIGGSDAGIAAALRAREVNPEAEVTVVVADDYPNYSICGLPFYLSGEVERRSVFLGPSFGESFYVGTDYISNGLAVLHGLIEVTLQFRTHLFSAFWANARDPLPVKNAFVDDRFDLF